MELSMDTTSMGEILLQMAVKPTMSLNKIVTFSNA
jgi:hypothetical protein